MCPRCAASPGRIKGFQGASRRGSRETKAPWIGIQGGLEPLAREKRLRSSPASCPAPSTRAVRAFAMRRDFLAGQPPPPSDSAPDRPNMRQSRTSGKTRMRIPDGQSKDRNLGRVRSGCGQSDGWTGICEVRGLQRPRDVGDRTPPASSVSITAVQKFSTSSLSSAAGLKSV